MENYFWPDHLPISCFVKTILVSRHPSYEQKKKKVIFCLMMSHFRMKKLKKITESRNFQNISVILYPNFTYTYIYFFFRSDLLCNRRARSPPVDIRQNSHKLFRWQSCYEWGVEESCKQFSFLTYTSNLAVFTLQSQKSVLKSHGHQNVHNTYYLLKYQIHKIFVVLLMMVNNKYLFFLP